LILLSKAKTRPQQHHRKGCHAREAIPGYLAPATPLAGKFKPRY
jgi:hypothetical protein